VLHSVKNELIRYDTRCYFNVSQLNLSHGTNNKQVEN